MSKIIALKIDSRKTAALVLGCGIVVLAGWQFNIPALKGSFKGSFITPNTALCFIGCALALLFWSIPSRNARIAARALGFGVATFAGAIFFEYVLGADFGIDGLFFHHTLQNWSAMVPDLPPGRFAFNTSIGFMCAGAAIMLLDSKWRIPVFQIPSVAVLGIAYLGILGYIYHVSPFYSRWMALPTAALFFLLAVAILLAHPGRGLMSTVLSTAAGGYLARALLVLTFSVMPLLGFVRILVRQKGPEYPGMATALMVLASVAILSISILAVAAALNKADGRREEAELALRRTEKLAAAGRFAATIAHEMNNPLAAVMNLVYLAQSQGTLDPETRALLSQAQQELKRVAHISRQTLSFYKETAGSENFSASDLLGEVLFLMQGKVSNKNLTIQTNADDSQIRAVKGEIRQVLSNLFANAIDASPDGGLIRIRVHRLAEDTVSIEIEDHGHGISSSDIKRLFQPFFTTKADVGNGLGLWVSKNLVEKNGGTISVKSSVEPEKNGSVFSVQLPAAAYKKAAVRNG